MKNTDIDFSRLRENTGRNIQKGIRQGRFFSAVKTYAVYPVTLLCLLLGLVFTLEDGVGHVFATAEDTANDTENVSLHTPVTDDDEDECIPENGKDIFELPYILGIDDREPLGLSEYYYLNRDVLPDDIYGFNYNLVPEGHTAIVPISLARESNGGEMYIKNGSAYELDADDYDGFKLPPYEQTDEYTVLIIHTHGTEAYTPDGVLSDDPEDPYVTRSRDNEENVISVGAVMANVFEEHGIKTLHHTVAIDATVDDFYDSYTASAKVIRDAVRKYPSIKYVFDVHRDGLALSSGEKAKVICEVDGKLAAQVMSVVGTNSLGQDHPDWEENLAFAVTLQRQLEDGYTDFCRPINVKENTYNQQYYPMGVLLEIGTDGNTLEEAQYAAQILACEIAEMIKGE